MIAKISTELHDSRAWSLGARFREDDADRGTPATRRVGRRRRSKTAVEEGN
jgi:hypothetical protein